MTPGPPPITLGALVLAALQNAAGAALLGTIAYRFYSKRPQLDVPRTQQEILDYKRTGKYPRAGGFSGYRIEYPTPWPWLVFGLAAAAAAALGSSLLLRHRAAAAIPLAAGGLYCATLAGLLVHEARAGRHARVRRLLAALNLPGGAQVLTIESLHGLLGIAAARHLPAGHVTIVAQDAMALEATRINLRRANLTGRASVEPDPPLRDYDAILLQDGQSLDAAAQHVATSGRIAIAGGRKPPIESRLAWHAIRPGFPAACLRVLTLGRIAPQATWAARATAFGLWHQASAPTS